MNEESPREAGALFEGLGFGSLRFDPFVQGREKGTFFFF